MNWKFTSLLSGAGVVATLLAAGTPNPFPSAARPMRPRGAMPVTTPASDIVQQAARLQLRFHQNGSYEEPTRDPFRFTRSERVLESPTYAPMAAAVGAPVESVPAVQQAPRVSLAGIATDLVGQVPERTAVISTPFGVALAKVGDDILTGQYRVSAIQEDAVELVATSDGTTLRLTLAIGRPQQAQ